MYQVSDKFKEYCKRHIRTFKNATITYYEGNEQQTIESEEIIKFDISAEPYIDYQIIGQAVAKKIHISIKGSYDLANKEINVTTTMIYDDNTEEVLNLGNYIIASDYDSSVKDQCSFTGYDYMIKMDDAYSDEGLTYPCTIRDVIENICEQKDIELATTDLPNGDLEVIGNNFQDGATYRDVIKQIAQVNGTFAYIDRENKLHIDTLMNHETIQGEGTSINLQGTTAYGEIIDYMLEGNTTQNGTPTPSSPVPVNNVTGEQVVRVRGKNRFNLQKLISFGLGSHFSALDNGIISTVPERTDWSGNAPPMTASPTLDQREIIYNYGISVTPGEQLTISFDNPNGTYAEVLVFYYDKDANYLSVQSLGARNNEQYVSSFSVRANARYIMFRFDNEDYNHGAKQLNIQNIQLETGSIATDYEEFAENVYDVNLGVENLLQIKTDLNTAQNGLQFKYESDGAVSITGTANATNNYYIPLQSNIILDSSTHTFSCKCDGTIENNISSVRFIATGGISFGDTSKTLVSNSQVYITSNDTNSSEYKFCLFSFTNGKSYNIKLYFQLEKGSKANSYTPYKTTPIELNKIGNYQDYIRKGTGKNLFDGQLELGMYDETGAKATNNANYRNVAPINVQPNTTYTFSINGTSQKYVIYLYKKDGTFIRVNTLTSGTFTTPAEAYLLNFRCFNADFTSDYANLKIQLEEGSATYYEPYGYKDKWYIKKNIGKHVFDGSSDEVRKLNVSGKYYKYQWDTALPDKYNVINTPLYCNYFPQITVAQGDFINVIGITNGVYPKYSIQIVCAEASLDAFKTWLSTHNTIVYYVLANPTYTLIENEKLIEQLNALNNGYVYGTNSNILVSGNIPSIINISVDAPGRDVEEEITPSNYLTDFKQSREYGPVNRVQITMTDIEDATYIENEESITKDGIQTITINDNYFLSSEELKAKAIRPLWNSLYTMKYMPISCKYLGLPYIEMNDYIGVVLPNGDVTGTYVFNYKFTYNGGYMGELETPTISRTQETYPTESINSQVQKMGINVDRANARITSEIIARQETDENVTRIEQSIDEINLSVSTTQTDLSNLEGQVQTNTASIGVNADNILLAVEKNTQTQDQLDTLQTNTENVVNQLVFNGDGLTISALGSTSDDMKLNLTNDAINFMYNNNVILKINGSTIEFANASFQKLDLGNYVWVAEDDDSLSLIYEGE